MKISNLLTLGLLSTCLFTACSDDDDTPIKETGNVVFNSQISSVQSRVNGATWDDNDEIGIFMQVEGTEVANKKYLAKADGSLTAAPEYAFRYPSTGTANFLAYYPYNASLAGKTATVSVADQNNPSKIDFLYSNNATGIKNGETVTLQFNHKLSKLDINLKGDETVKDLKGIAVALTGMNTTATVNLADGVLSAADSKANINLKVNAAGTFAEAIVLPAATVENSKLVFSLSDKTYEWTMTVPGNKIEGGCKYTFNATVSIFEGQPVVKMGNAVITDWTDKAGGNIDVDFGGEDRPVETDVLLDEKFDANEGSFTIHNVTLPEGSTYVWKWSSYDNKGTIDPIKFMKASAFVHDHSQASEGWLVSKELQLPADDSFVLTIKHAHNYSNGDKTQELSLMVAKAGTEVSAAATGWTKVEIPTYGTGEDYNYVTATVDLSAYKGQNIQFAFRYISSTESSPTWQIDEVKVAKGTVAPKPNPDPEPDPEPEPEPEPDPDPVDGTILMNESFGDPQKKDGKYWPALNEYTSWTDTHNLTYSDPYLGDNKYSTVSIRSTKTMDGHLWFASGKNGGYRIEGIKSAGYKTIQLTYDIAANAKGNQNIIKVSTDKGDIAVPSVEITKMNVYQEVTLTLPTDFTYLQFTGNADTNEAGYRIDNIKVIAK